MLVSMKASEKAFVFTELVLENLIKHITTGMEKKR